MMSDCMIGRDLKASAERPACAECYRLRPDSVKERCAFMRSVPRR